MEKRTSGYGTLIRDGKRQCMKCMEFFDKKFDLCPYCGEEVDRPVKELLHMDPGTLIHNRYIVGNSIGYGGFGITYIGWDTKLKRKVAIKEYMPSEFSTRMIHKSELIIANNEKKQKQFEAGKAKFLREAEKLAQVGNIDGIVHVHDSFEENKTAYITMEYLEGETLAAYLEKVGRVSEEEAMDLMMPVMEALDEVHEKGIIHRDIAPDNIFLSRDSENNVKVKLIDFGAAKFATTSHSKSLTVIIKPGYSPEEQYRSNGDQGVYTDVYALAAVMYRMVTGKVPPDAFERRTAIESKKKDLLEEPTKYNSDLSENFETALLNAMNVKAEDRTPTMGSFVGELISYEPVKRRGVSIRKIDYMKWPLWAKIGVPVAGFVSLTLVVLLALGIVKYGSNLKQEYALPTGMARVPDLVNENIEEAQQWMEEAGLITVTAGSEYAPNVVENLVLTQDIAAGSIVRSNSVVSVTVSAAEETFLLPNVVGMDLSDAQMALECMGIIVETENAATGGLCKGAVCSQSIEPFAEVKSGDSIVLGVSTQGSSKAANVPKLEGLDYETALKTAEKAGVVLVVGEKKFIKDCEDNSVLKQSIPAGKSVKAGETVEITVAHEWREFEMPNLLYKNQATAVQLLKNIGLDSEVINRESDVVAVGKVIGQDIASGEKVQPGDKIVLSVSKGGKPFPMPNVVSMKEEKGQTLLLNSGLSVAVEYTYDSKISEGEIVKQSIRKDISVTRGKEVIITVNSKKNLISVEKIIGLSQKDAENRLKKQGFKVQVSEVYSDTVAEGKVISQLPEAGNLQKKDTVIILTVSKGSKDSGAVGGSGWSEWTTKLPSGVTSSKYVIDQKTQYRSRSVERTTSSESDLPGWSLYAQDSEWGAYGSWTSWSTQPVSSSNSRRVQTKTQYRYRDKETTTSTSSSLSGWTKTGSSSGWTNYGGWSNWQDGAVSASDSRQVEKRTVYGYYYYLCPNCGAHMHVYTQCFTWAGGCGSKAIASYQYKWNALWSTTPWNNAGFKDWYGTGKMYTTINGQLYFKWDDGNGNPKTQYRYRDRSYVTNYTYERWGSWSSYADNAYSSSATRQVESRTVYRYSDRKLIKTYYHERLGPWSKYGDQKIAETSDTEVQSRVVYRYRKK